MPYIARGGRQEGITVPAGSSIAINSPGAGTTKVYYGQPYPAGNLPTNYALQAQLTSAATTLGPFATAQVIRLEASYACDIEYEIGVSPTLNGGVANAAFTSNTATASTTLTPANISGGLSSVDLAMTGALAAAGTATLPTVAALIAAEGAPQVGDSYRLRVINESSGAFAWTIATAAGWTLTGTMSVAQNTWREFILTLTSATTATLQSVAVGTYS